MIRVEHLKKKSLRKLLALMNMSITAVNFIMEDCHYATLLIKILNHIIEKIILTFAQ